jgi:Glyoxalase/Bleomycin resistance protein/Dioxygenase superfamily
VVPPLSGLTFDHVGVACTDIQQEAARLSALGYTIDGEPFIDPLQGVRGVFLSGQAPRLELLEPLPDKDAGVLTPWLNQGVKLYHLAYATPTLRDSMVPLQRGRAKILVPPAPAVAFSGREIAFVMLPNRMLIELIALE